MPSKIVKAGGTKKTPEDDQAITSVLEATDDEIDAEEDPELYETDPDLVHPDIVVNVVAAPILLPKGEHRNSTVRLLKGDRVKGAYYRKMVTKHKTPGLAVCASLEKAYLEKLEKERQERIGEKPPKWVLEAWALKDKEPPE